jgi:hypothetical protein
MDQLITWQLNLCLVAAMLCCPLWLIFHRRDTEKNPGAEMPERGKAYCLRGLPDQKGVLKNVC